MTPHIQASTDEVASIVIMPGDPLRAKYIASNFLKDAKIINNIRMNLGYTGYYNGKLVTVFSSGMGSGSMGIYAYELFKYYNVEKIIRVGSCGSYFSEIKVKDLILVENSFTLSNFAYQYSGNFLDLCSSSINLNKKIAKIACEQGIDLKYGNINSSDVFYHDYNDERIKQNYCLGVEMECFALFYIAKVLNKEASAILTVSDNLVTHDEMSAFEREKTLNTAIKLALDSID